MKDCGSEPPTMHSDRVSTTGSEGRKSSKPIMEKRRRARINASLAELKSLLLEVIKKEGARHSKMEKADILEMAVKHLRHIQRQQYTSGGSDPTLMDKYRLGFNECVQEVSRYLGAAEDDDAELRARLLNHLANCITSSDDSLSPLSTPSSSPGPSLHANGQVSSSSGSPESGSGVGVSGVSGGGVVTPLTPIPVRPGSKPPTGCGGAGSLAGFSMLAVGANSNPPLPPPSAALLLPSNPAEINNNVATFANNNVVFSSADILNVGGGGVGGAGGFLRGVSSHHVTLATTTTSAAAPSSSPSSSPQELTASFPGTKLFGEPQVMASPTHSSSNNIKTLPAAPAAVTPIPGALPVPAPAAGEVTFVLPANVMTGGPFHSYLIPVITSPHGLAAPSVSLTHNPAAAAAAHAHAPLPLSLPVMAAAPPQGSVAGNISTAPAPQGLVTFSPGNGAVVSSPAGLSHVVATGPLNASLAWHPAAASTAFTTTATVYNPSTSTFSSPSASALPSTSITPLSPSAPSPSSSTLSPTATRTPPAHLTISPTSSSGATSSPSSTVTSTTIINSAAPEESTGATPLLTALSSERTTRDGVVSLVLAQPHSQIRATATSFQIDSSLSGTHAGASNEVCGTPVATIAGGSGVRLGTSLLHSQLARPQPVFGSSQPSSSSPPSSSVLPSGVEAQDCDESVWRPW